jgi:hypothetical protein
MAISGPNRFFRIGTDMRKLSESPERLLPDV